MPDETFEEDDPPAADLAAEGETSAVAPEDETAAAAPEDEPSAVALEDETPAVALEDETAAAAPEDDVDREQAVAWFLAEMARTATVADKDLSGSRLGSVEVVRRLSDSTFGTMYEGRDMAGGGTGERVALRVVSDRRVPEAERRSQVLAAARAAVGVTHPNLAAVRWAEEIDGLVVVVSDLVPGMRLSERLARVHQPALSEVQTIARGVAQGLAAAHAAGLTHLDVEPGNVMLTHTSGVKLLDVGLGRAAGATLRGAAGYASPEQTRGERCDTRSDVFSFGVLLYELLTGDAPFRGDSGAEVLDRVRRADRRALAALRDDVPQDLAAIVDCCLEVEPEDRFGDASALLEALVQVAPGPLIAAADAPEETTDDEPEALGDEAGNAAAGVGEAAQLDAGPADGASDTTVPAMEAHPPVAATRSPAAERERQYTWLPVLAVLLFLAMVLASTVMKDDRETESETEVDRQPAP